MLGLEQTRRWIIFYGGNLLLVLLGLAALLALIWFGILVQLKSYSQGLDDIAASFQGQSLDQQKQQITSLNDYLNKLNQIQKNHQRYSLVLKELANLLPAGVRLESLSIDAKGQVSLAGFAPQRTQVLTMQDALAKSKFFKEVANPLANLTKQINIDFNFKFNLNPPELIND